MDNRASHALNKELGVCYDSVDEDNDAGNQGLQIPSLHSLFKSLGKCYKEM